MDVLKPILRIVFVTALLTGCGEEDRLRAKITHLQSENKKLQIELEDIKNNPQRLMTLAQKNYVLKDYSSALNVIRELINKYPTSTLVSDARVLKDRAMEALAKEDEANAAIAKKETATKKRRLATALKRMRKSRDEMVGVTWYHDRASPRMSSGKAFYLYIGKGGSTPPMLRSVVRYAGDSWLFIKSYSLNVDGQRFKGDPAKFKRDNSGGDVWEWADELIELDDIYLFKIIAASKKAVVRFNGNNYYSDKVITAKEKRALRNVLDAYEVLQVEYKKETTQ